MTGAAVRPDVLAAHAAGYASRGVKVFPLWHVDQGICVCADGPECGSPGKHPRIPRGVSQATADLTTVAAWWRRWPAANIGLPAGDNGLGIIDVDPRHGGDDTLATLCAWCEARGVDLMATWTIRTGSGGLHLYFRDADQAVKTTARSFGAPGVDTRGRGGYVVAPPSLHASGGRYEVVSDQAVRLAPWPAILTPLLDAPRRPAPANPAQRTDNTASQGRSTAWALAGLTAEAADLATLQPGSDRNNRLNASAYKMGRRVGAGLLEESEAHAALVDAASGWSGHTAREIDATVRSGLRAGKARPHSGPTTRGGA